MPAAVPFLAAGAGFLAADAAIAAGFTLLGSSLVAGLAVGALTGAVVGGLGAAITGGDIGEGILFGAVGGAVGGTLAGVFTPNVFGVGLSSGSSSASALSGSASVDAFGVGNSGTAFNSMGTIGGTTTTSSSGVSAAGAAGLTSKDMLTYSLVSGGANMLSGMGKEQPYPYTEEGWNAKLAAEKEMNATNNQTARDTNAATLAQRQAEAELQAKLNREQLAQNQSQFDLTINEKRADRERPIEEMYAKLQRQRETATGLTMTRKQLEAQKNLQNETQQDIDNYVYS